MKTTLKWAQQLFIPPQFEIEFLWRQPFSVCIHSLLYPLNNYVHSNYVQYVQCTIPACTLNGTLILILLICCLGNVEKNIILCTAHKNL